MACKTETKEIGDHEYSVTQWSAEKAMIMKFRLTKTFGASLASILNMEGEDKEAEALSKCLSTLFKDNSPEEIVSLIKECVLKVGCDGTRITETTFNELFSGDDLLEVYKVFIFVIQVNYGNLLRGQLADRFLAKVKENL